MMDNVSPSHHEGSVSPSLPHIFSSVKQESTDCWNPQLLNSSNGMVSENYSTYTPLETLYPDTSYASSAHAPQYYTFGNSSSCIQSLYPCPNVQEESDVYIVQPTVYRDVDLSYSARDEGLGSSPSSFNSSSPPLNLPATAHEQPAVSLSSVNNYNCQRTNERSSPEDLAYEEYPPAECGNCGSRLNVTWYTNHYLCGNCFLEKTRTPVLPPEDAQNDRKRKRSTEPETPVLMFCKQRLLTVNKKDNQICTNCETVSTTLWRRSCSGSSVCNACGLYEKLHKTPRPKSMRKDTIQTRKRKPKASQSRQRKKSSSGSKVQPGIQRVQPCSSDNQEQYPLPTYNSLQMRNLPLNLNPIRNAAPLPPMNGNSFFPNYRSDMYALYHSVPPNEVMNDVRVPPPPSPANS